MIVGVHRRRLWIGPVLASLWPVACSHANPAFEGSAEGTASGGETTGSQASGGAATSGSTNPITLADDTVDGSSGDGPDVPLVACPGVLFAVSDLGLLYIIDLEAEEVYDTQTIEGPSWAVATDPRTGEILYTLSPDEIGSVETDTVYRQNPTDEGSTLIGTVDVLDGAVGRAGFGAGSLWLATHETRQLLRVDPDDPSLVVGEWLLEGSASRGGDLVVVDDSELVMVGWSNELFAVLIDDGGSVSVLDPIYLDLVEEQQALTGLARDGDGTWWACDLIGNLYDLGPDLSEADVPYIFSIGEGLQDLSPVWARPEQCPPGA